MRDRVAAVFFVNVSASAEIPTVSSIVEQKTPYCPDISLADLYYAPDSQIVRAILIKLLAQVVSRA